MEKKDSLCSNPQRGQLFTPRSSSEKPRSEDMPDININWGRKRVAKRNFARKPVLKRRKLSLHKIMETENSTTLASKQPQASVAVPLDAVANGTKAPHVKSQENSVQEQHESSRKMTHTMSESASNLPCVNVKPEASEAEDGLVNFRGLARIPRCHASLLEKECLDRPNLAICSGRTMRWRQFACETLGELLFLLRSTRGREMTGERREHLERLWEDAGGLGLDLSWLEKSVRFGLESGSYLEQKREAVAAMGAEVRRLEERKGTLRCQLSTLTMLLCENKRARAGLELAVERLKGELKSAEEAFLY